MEIQEKLGSVPTVSVRKNKHVFLVLGSILGALVLVVGVNPHDSACKPDSSADKDLPQQNSDIHQYSNSNSNIVSR